MFSPILKTLVFLSAIQSLANATAVGIRSTTLFGPDLYSGRRYISELGSADASSDASASASALLINEASIKTDASASAGISSKGAASSSAQSDVSSSTHSSGRTSLSSTAEATAGGAASSLAISGGHRYISDLASAHASSAASASASALSIDDASVVADASASAGISSKGAASSNAQSHVLSTNHRPGRTSLSPTAEVMAKGAVSSLGTSAIARSASVSAPVSMSVMTSAYASLSSDFSECHTGIAASASVEVAAQFVANLSAKVETVSEQYGNCACNGSNDPEANAQFQVTIQQFFSDLQMTIQSAKTRYPQDWESHFSGSFQRCVPAVKSAGNACSAARIDLAGLLAGIHLDLGLFAGAGLNLSGLLGLNLNLGLGVGLLGL